MTDSPFEIRETQDGQYAEDKLDKGDVFEAGTEKKLVSYAFARIGQTVDIDLKSGGVFRGLTSEVNEKKGKADETIGVVNDLLDTKTINEQEAGAIFAALGKAHGMAQGYYALGMAQMVSVAMPEDEEFLKGVRQNSGDFYALATKCAEGKYCQELEAGKRGK